VVDAGGGGCGGVTAHSKWQAPLTRRRSRAADLSHKGRGEEK
jgi:hypothetical protein